MEDNKFDELMSAVVNGFNRLENKMGDGFAEAKADRDVIRADLKTETGNLSRKVVGIQNQLDNEVIRASNKVADIETRVIDLEQA